MKRKIRLFGILLVITALIIMQLPVTEADAATSASDFKMEGTTLIKYRGDDTNISIPNTVEVIGEKAFENNKNVEVIVMPKSVQNIEAYAFWGCDNLNTVVLGSGLSEVGDFAFANCKSLKHITLPENIRGIGIQAFADCVSMTDLYIAPEVTRIHETAFDGCYQLTIHCEPGSVADDFTEAFYKKQEEMPEYEDVERYVPEEPSVDENADVEGENSNEEVIPTEESFLGATHVVGNHAVVFLDNTSLQVLDGEAVITEEEEQPEEEGGIPKYTIVDGKIIADQAYYRNQKIENVAIPEGVEEVGQFSFARSALHQISIPKGVKWIDYGAFYHCDSLINVELPNTVENVEPKAFAHTAWVKEFEENASEDFLISGGVLVAYKGTSPKVKIPEGVRVIAGEVFAGHFEISEVYLPDSLVTIGEAAFEDCRCLSTIKFGSSVKQIKDRAFSNINITKIDLPESVEELGIKAFDTGIKLTYAGNKPMTTHETSAERLSNEEYRNCGRETNTPGVKVLGLQKAQAKLEGTARSYKLTITEASDNQVMARAYERGMQESLPKDMVLYQFKFTDNSGIPIMKLGKQLLEVTLPVPKLFRTQNVEVYTMDRNGQLEMVDAVRVNVDGVDCVRFTTNYISQYGITGLSLELAQENVLKETTSIVKMSAPPKTTVANGIKPQFLIGGVLLLLGTICIFYKKH